MAVKYCKPNYSEARYNEVELYVTFPVSGNFLSKLSIKAAIRLNFIECNYNTCREVKCLYL